VGTIQARTMDELEGYVKGLWFGNPKQRKTTYLAGAARLGRIVAIDIEGEGWLKKPLRDQGIPVENIIKYGPVASYKDMEQIYWEVKGMFDDADEAGTPELAPIAVCVDHVTDLEARLLTEARSDRLGRLIRPLEKKARGGSAEAQAALDDLNLFKNERDDYGVWTNQARHLMRMYRDLPCHVGFAAQFRTDMGVRVPSLTEKFRVDLMGSMNVVIGCTLMQAGGETAGVGYSVEQDGWYGGDRFNVLRPITVNPSFDRVIAAAEGKLDFATDPEQVAFKQALTG
jgi:hypothetical protein